MAKKYIITLSETERQEFQRLLRKPRFNKMKARNMRILLGADQGEAGKQMNDEQIAKAYDVTTRTVRNVRRRCIEHGLDYAVNGKPRELNPSRIKVTAEVENHLVTLSQNVPPSGFASWSLRLLAGQMVELEYIESISHEKVRQVLKKTA